MADETVVPEAATEPTATKPRAKKPAAKGKEVGVTIDPSTLSVFGKTDAERALIVKAANSPKVSVFMGRKVNLGNYENVDFSFSIQMPVGMGAEEKTVFNDLALEALQDGLDIIKGEINTRTVNIYRQIGRLPQPEETEEADG